MISALLPIALQLIVFNRIISGIFELQDMIPQFYGANINNTQEGQGNAAVHANFAAWSNHINQSGMNNLRNPGTPTPKARR